MSVPFLPAIDLAQGLNASTGLSAASLGHFGAVYAVATQQTIDAAFDHLKQTAAHFGTYFDVTKLESTDDILSLLDAGAVKVFVSSEQLKNIQTKNVDASRLVLSLAGAGNSALDVLQGNEVGIYLAAIADVTAVESLLEAYGSNRPPVYVSLAQPTLEKALQIAHINATPVIAAQHLTVDPKSQPNLIPAAPLLLANATTDRPDSLFTTLVTDERGVALGLVYSSEESISESLRTGRGVFQSRKRGLWYKGDTSGDIQELIRIDKDCDGDALRFVVHQKGRGFCHLATPTCFGDYAGLSRLEKTLSSRKRSAPEGSYTARLFNDPKMLSAKILEEAQELVDATDKDNIAAEAADVIYFALTKCIANDVSLEDIERNLDAKNLKVKRRKGDAKPQFAEKVGMQVNGEKEMVKEAASVPKAKEDPTGTIDGRISMRRYYTTKETKDTVQQALQRPSQKSTERIMGIVNPIIECVRKGGDKALLEYTHKFEKATSLTTTVLRAPFPENLMQIAPETKEAIDISYENIRKFHAAQETEDLRVETMPGVVCSRFVRPIERVGLYVPGGTAVLPSTTLMLGVPAKVAGCKKIVIASPPRSDGSITPEIVYVAHKVGAESIVLAGGAQAVAAMAYGTESVTKVDKILGPGNQFVTAAKMIVSNDTSAGVSIDMPAGPSEVMVIADKTSNPAFVASDLLSQAEHGVDSQVVLIAIDMSEKELQAVEDELHNQAVALPRVDIVRGAIAHSLTLVVKTREEAMELSNFYAPEHLILQVEDAEAYTETVENAGSVFIGPWTPESVGDYSAGVNHSLRKLSYPLSFIPNIKLTFLSQPPTATLSNTPVSTLAPTSSTSPAQTLQPKVCATLARQSCNSPRWSNSRPTDAPSRSACSTWTSSRVARFIPEKLAFVQLLYAL
jgi:phosphoribosyl-ATP pyrophosphohydrolase/phosphoribosyl-AMP cyclohydrolase/histidinol dehydrogenase